MTWIGVGRGNEGVPSVLVKKNGLIIENKTALKIDTDILLSSAANVSESGSTDYIEVVSET